MKTAICLFGVVSGEGKNDCRGGYVDYKMCFDSYKKHIIDINDADIFMHSWSENLETEVSELYLPKKKIFEKQIQFNVKSRKGKEDDCQRNLSKTYSLKKSLGLKKQYEIENNFIYDCVMLLRFDAIFFVDIFFKGYDLKYFWASNYNNPIRIHRKTKKVLPADRINISSYQKQITDIFLFSNSSIMDKYSYYHDALMEGKRYPQWSHHCSLHAYVNDNIGNVKENVRYTLYREFDYELYRYCVSKEYDIRDS